MVSVGVQSQFESLELTSRPVDHVEATIKHD